MSIEANRGLQALPPFRLDGRLAVVTGASEGIGRALAIALAQAGARLVLASRRSDALDETRRAIEQIGGRAVVHPVDVRQVKTIQTLAAFVEREIGDDAVPLVLVNNAGAPLTKPALDVTAEDWDLVHETSLRGLFFCCQAFGRLMIARGYGKIINLSSTWSASTDADKSVYCAAKAGVSHLTAALATEWAPLGVRVNALAPTAVLTPSRVAPLEGPRAARLLARIPMGRFATPSDLFGAAVFLASSASDFITGQTLFVDGGWHALG